MRTAQQAQTQYVSLGGAETFEELPDAIPDRELDKGDRIKIVISLKYPVAPVFNSAGVEHVFRSHVPADTTLVDIWGEGKRRAVVELEVDPPLPLVPILIGVAAFGGIVIVSWLGIMTLREMTRFVEALTSAPGVMAPIAIGTVVLIGVGAYLLLRRRR